MAATEEVMMTALRCLMTAGLVGVALFAGPACGVSAAQPATQPAAVTVDDSTLKSRIGAILEKDASLAARDLDVAVSQGVVTLKGVVRTARERARAGRAARITGVTKVLNEITVDATISPKSKADRAAAKVKGGADKAMDETKKATGTAVDKTKGGLDKAVDVTKDAVSTAGEVVTDGWITTKVKAKFADEKVLEGSDINVDTSDHVVTLKGTVTSDAGRTRAKEIAEGTKGVTRVVNQLVVK
jgi:hyperosmotically inducible periplasmic protein